MNKSVLISLSPYWYYLIGEGIKTIEVRKTIPQSPDWDKQVYCYMTKDKKSFAQIPKEFQEKYRAYMGRVGMQFTRCGIMHPNDSLKLMAKQSCLSEKQLDEYAQGKMLYGLRVSALALYDKPKELWEFKRNCGQYGTDNPLCDDCKYFIDGRSYEYDESDCAVCGNMPLTRPPQSWCYVEKPL